MATPAQERLALLQRTIDVDKDFHIEKLYGVFESIYGQFCPHEEDGWQLFANDLEEVLSCN